MSVNSRRGLRACVVGLAVAGALAGAAAAQTPEAPAVDDAAAKAVFVKACTTCHDAGTTTSRRMSDGEWRDMVNRMGDMGAPADAKELDVIAAYLSANYGLRPVGSAQPKR